MGDDDASNLSVTFDLYNDFLLERDSAGISLEQLEKSNAENETRVTELTEQLKTTQTQNTSLIGENTTLRRNISELLKTAQAELKRKDYQLNELRESQRRNNYWQKPDFQGSVNARLRDLKKNPQTCQTKNHNDLSYHRRRSDVWKKPPGEENNSGNSVGADNSNPKVNIPTNSEARTRRLQQDRESRNSQPNPGSLSAAEDLNERTYQRDGSSERRKGETTHSRDMTQSQHSSCRSKDSNFKGEQLSQSSSECPALNKMQNDIRSKSPAAVALLSTYRDCTKSSEREVLGRRKSRSKTPISESLVANIKSKSSPETHCIRTRVSETEYSSRKCSEISNKLNSGRKLNDRYVIPKRTNSCKDIEEHGQCAKESRICDSPISAEKCLGSPKPLQDGVKRISSPRNQKREQSKSTGSEAVRRSRDLLHHRDRDTKETPRTSSGSRSIQYNRKDSKYHAYNSSDRKVEECSDHKRVAHSRGLVKRKRSAEIERASTHESHKLHRSPDRLPQKKRKKEPSISEHRECTSPVRFTTKVSGNRNSVESTQESCRQDTKLPSDNVDKDEKKLRKRNRSERKNKLLKRAKTTLHRIHSTPKEHKHAVHSENERKHRPTLMSSTRKSFRESKNTHEKASAPYKTSQTQKCKNLTVHSDVEDGELQDSDVEDSLEEVVRPECRDKMLRQDGNTIETHKVPVVDESTKKELKPKNTNYIQPADAKPHSKDAVPNETSLIQERSQKNASKTVPIASKLSVRLKQPDTDSCGYSSEHETVLMCVASSRENQLESESVSELSVLQDATKVFSETLPPNKSSEDDINIWCGNELIVDAGDTHSVKADDEEVDDRKIVPLRDPNHIKTADESVTCPMVPNSVPLQESSHNKGPLPLKPIAGQHLLSFRDLFGDDSEDMDISKEGYVASCTDSPGITLSNNQQSSLVVQTHQDCSVDSKLTITNNQTGNLAKTTLELFGSCSFLGDDSLEDSLETIRVIHKTQPDCTGKKIKVATKSVEEFERVPSPKSNSDVPSRITITNPEEVSSMEQAAEVQRFSNDKHDFNKINCLPSKLSEICNEVSDTRNEELINQSLLTSVENLRTPSQSEQKDYGTIAEPITAEASAYTCTQKSPENGKDSEDLLSEHNANLLISENPGQDKNAFSDAASSPESLRGNSDGNIRLSDEQADMEDGNSQSKDSGNRYECNSPPRSDLSDGEIISSSESEITVSPKKKKPNPESTRENNSRTRHRRKSSHNKDTRHCHDRHSRVDDEARARFMEGKMKRLEERLKSQEMPQKRSDHRSDSHRRSQQQTHCPKRGTVQESTIQRKSTDSRQLELDDRRTLSSEQNGERNKRRNRQLTDHESHISHLDNRKKADLMRKQDHHNNKLERTAEFQEARERRYHSQGGCHDSLLRHRVSRELPESDEWTKRKPQGIRQEDRTSKTQNRTGSNGEHRHNDRRLASEIVAHVPARSHENRHGSNRHDRPEKLRQGKDTTSRR